MTVRLSTASYRFASSERLDVTRVGVDRAIRAGHPADGAPFAPSSRILWPAKAHLDLVAALDRRAAALPAGEAAAFVAIQAEELLAKTEAAYFEAYRGEMKQSYRRHRPAWDALLAREEVTVVCFCPRREPGAGQRHTCHRHHLARMLGACGAIDEGERCPPPPANPSKPKALPPLENYLAVSGARPPPPGSSRELHQIHREILADVAKTVRTQPPGTVVVHGGADGVDSAAGRAAREAGHEEVVYLPWYDAWGNVAPLVRNAYVATCPRGIFWIAPWSKGTPQAVALAKQAGVEVDERRVG
jgi:hypothetical protein